MIEHHSMNEEVKPKRAKRQFDEAFRRQAVALVETSGRPLREMAVELGVSVWNLRDWKEIYGQRSTPAQLAEQLQRLRAENERLKKNSARPVQIKVSEKGGVSVYGLGRFPVTLYKEQWTKLLDMAAELRAFITENEAKLKTKGQD